MFKLLYSNLMAKEMDVDMPARVSRIFADAIAAC